jgi:hypothetical protein
MKTKKSTSSNNRKVVLSDGTEVTVTDNQRRNILRGNISKHEVPKEKLSTETGKTNDEWEVTDDLNSSKFPPPSNHPLFRKFWAENIDNITGRENFNPAHLGLLEALCRLRVELRALDDFVMKHGHTFRTRTALGEQRKTYPEVNERMKVLSQIAVFSRLLDLVPKKDKSKGGAKDGEDWE